MEVVASLNLYPIVYILSIILTCMDHILTRRYVIYEQQFAS